MPYSKTDALVVVWFLALFVLVSAFLRALQFMFPDNPFVKALGVIA